MRTKDVETAMCILQPWSHRQMKTSFPRNFILASSLASLALCIANSASFAQQAVLKKACAADYQSLCSGVQPGGGRIIACLKQNSAKLSPDCQQALMAAAKTMQ